MTVVSSRRTALLEKYRDINVDYQWWDSVYADFTEDMKAVGIDVRRMYFTGFWSQGDGACFAGKLNNTLAYLDHHHKDQYPMIRKLLEHGGGVRVKCTHSGHYYHATCTEFWVDADALTGIIPQPTEFHEAIVERWQDQLQDEVDAFEKDIIEQWRSYMGDLYKKLEAEHDYLTSDEAVWEAIEANELDQDAEDHDEAA